MNNKRIYIALLIIGILLLPYVLNAPWTLFDYVVAGILLCTTAVVFEIVTSRITTQKKKIIAGVSVILIAIYIWAELAVGIFTTLGS